MLQELEQKKIKSFWERPEGKTGYLFLGLGAIGLYFALPFIITMLQNLITAMVLGVVAVGLFVMVTDKKLRNSVSLLYKILMRWMTNWVIDLDPIAVMKNYLEHLLKQLDSMRQQMGSLKGVIKGLEKTEEKMIADAQKARNMSEIARERNDIEAVNAQARKVGRRVSSVKEIGALKAELNRVYDILVKMEKAATFISEDTNDAIFVHQEKYKAMKAAGSVLSSAIKIIRGGGDEYQLYNEALERSTDEMNETMGQIENFLTISGSLINSVDLETAAYDRDAFSKLQEIEKQMANLSSPPSLKVINAPEGQVEVVGIGNHTYKMPVSAVSSTPSAPERKYLDL